MADKPVLSMKAAPGTGEGRVMHAVPHTLVAVGFYNGDDALKDAIRHAKRFMDHAKQTPGKPDSYLNMLVELDSLQELKIIDARLKVFQNFYMYTHFGFLYTNVSLCTHGIS